MGLYNNLDIVPIMLASYLNSRIIPKPYETDFIYGVNPLTEYYYPDKSVNFMKGTKGTNVATKVMDGLALGISTLSGGLSTKAGDIVLNAGHMLGQIPGVPGLIGSAIGLIGSGVNAAIGNKMNDANIAKMDSDIRERERYLFGDNSTSSALIAGAQNNVNLGKVGADYYGKTGFLNRLIGTGGKPAKIKYENDDRINLANLRAQNVESQAFTDYLNKMIRLGLLGNISAFGGSINNSFTHGALWDNGLVEINNGGSHELNPNLGVLYGVDDMGVPNLVEEGETIFNAGSYGGPDNYAFSNRLNFPVREYGEMFSLGGITKHKKGKRAKNYTFADVSKLLAKESEERPNDSKSLRTFAENLGKLALIQEEVKARDAISLMNPLDIIAALQQSPMGNQMVGDAQYNADEQAMMELQQEPMMAACGGKLHSLGGNLFKYGGRPRKRNTRRSRPRANVKVENGKVQPIPIYEGRFGSAFNAARNNGNTIFEWNGRTYNTRLRGESDEDYNDYIASKQLPILLNQLNSSIATEEDALLNNANAFGYGGPINLFADGGNTTNKLNNETYINGKPVNNIPDSMVLHDDLFSLAIEEYVKAEYDKYKGFVDKGKYEDAYNVANELNNNIVGIQSAYVNAMRNPVRDNIKELQTRFDNLGLNKYVNDFLSTKRKVGDKEDYPVYHRRRRKMVALTSDNFLDYLNGVITQNRFFKFNEDTEKMLRDMELPVTNYSEYAGTLDPNNPEDAPFIPTDAETYLSELPITKMRGVATNHVIKNPDYKEGGNEDEFISIYNDVLKYAPEDAESAEDWWNALSSEQQDEILKAHYKAGDLVRYGVYKNRQLYDVLDDNTSSNEETSNATTESSTDKKDNSDKSYYVPVPRKDWESKAALGVALNDYMNAMFGAGRTFQSPGMDAAYNYLSKVGNIPMVRSHPVGTKLLYVPIDLNYNLNVDRNDMLGALRENNNLNAGNGRNSQFQLINAFNKRIGDTRKQAVEDNLKTLSAILQNNNNVDLLNAQNSLTALSTNAQNIAKAKEALASGASQLASTLAQSYNNWLNYRNAQSSGLALLLYDMGYNKLILNLRDAAFLLNNQLPDALNTAGVQYVLYNPSLSNNKNK